MKTFMIEYFEKCLDNKVNEYTMNWIENNYHRLPEENSWHVWQDYINHFSKKDFWHDIIPYETIYEMYIEIGFSESSTKKLTLRLRQLMETPNSPWYHEPSVYEWLPRLSSNGRKETYQICNYYLI